MKSSFEDAKQRLNQAQGNVKTVYYATDNADSTLIGLNYLETDTLKMFMSPTRRLERIWACKHSGTMYPISQIPPEKYKLPEFVWFDYVRPLSKDDIFEWRPKKGGTEIKAERRRDAPLQTIPVAKKPVEEDKPAETVPEKENDAMPETLQDTHAVPDDTPATLRKEETEEQENV